MLLGKRPRPPMKRTTSMKEFTLDLKIGEPSDPPKGGSGAGPCPSGSSAFRPDHSFTATASPRNHHRNSADLVETAHFLRACSLCKRRLISGRDIYMYRGDSAFCSLECRQQQMAQDERKERCSLASKIKEASTTGAAGSEVVSAKSGAAAAV